MYYEQSFNISMNSESSKKKMALLVIESTRDRCSLVSAQNDKVPGFHFLSKIALFRAIVILIVQSQSLRVENFKA